MLKLLLIGLGGGLGSVFRYLIQGIFDRYFPISFPYGTFVVNITGCLLIGLIFGWMERSAGLSLEFRLFLITGICGGFTTFSTFSMESFLLFKEGNYVSFFLYLFLSVFLGILATFFGFQLLKS